MVWDHRAAARHRVVDLEVAEAVPGERGDAILRCTPKRLSALASFRARACASR